MRHVLLYSSQNQCFIKTFGRLFYKAVKSCDVEFPYKSYDEIKETVWKVYQTVLKLQTHREFEINKIESILREHQTWKFPMMSNFHLSFSIKIVFLPVGHSQ